MGFGLLFWAAGNLPPSAFARATSLSSVTVFISYSHDSDDHRDAVLALSERLRADGIDTRLDRYVQGSPAEGWPRWMLNQLDAATFVLVVCTATYYRRFRGHEAPGQGKGVDWEGALITQEIYDSRSATLRFVPVFLGPRIEAHIPEPLRSVTHYAPTSEPAYRALYDFLLGQAGVEPGPLGPLKTRPRATGTALSFGAPAPAEALPPLPADISRILKYAPAELIGREAETRLLDEAWARAQVGAAARPHLLVFVALGGEGKTSLVAKWAADLAARDWPGCEAVFAWSFYSQGTREQTAASSDLFLAEALAFFGDAAMAGGAAGAHDKGRRLARLVGERRALLILDGLEPLQHPPSAAAFAPGELKDQGLAALLRGLATTSRGLCLVTTRLALPDLRAFHGRTVREDKLARLARAAGVRLLRAHGVSGGERRTLPHAAADGKTELLNEFEKLVEDVDGHALTLHIMGAFLKRAFLGDIRRRDRVSFARASQKTDNDHAFRAMAAYEHWLADGGEEARRELALLTLLGLFDRPASAACLHALLQAPAIPGLTEPLVGLPEEDWNGSLAALAEATLLTVNRDAAGTLLALDAHPLLREYFGRRLREQQPEAHRAAHRRLYEHLCATTREGEQPTLEALQPLYQAVAHGCQAGLAQAACDEVYRDRILRGTGAGGFYSTKKLGALGADLGAVARFFEVPWSRVSPALTATDQAWLLAVVAFSLRALGRLGEAREPMRAGLEMRIEQEDWKNASISAGNLSELELTLGEVAGALRDAEQAVSYAERSGDGFQRMGKRTTLADARYQAGRRAEAEALFEEAERMQAEDQPGYPLLYSLAGFRYCDLLLGEAERAAGAVLWAGIPPAKAGPGHAGSARPPASASGDPAEACRAVAARANKMFEWRVPGDPLLDIALDHLSLGRAVLYAAVLAGPGDAGAGGPLPAAATSSPPLDRESAARELDAAVAGLRQAGTQDHFPRALLSRAWQRALAGALTGADSAQGDLDEAEDIAARGPMPLFQADIRLYRARLFHAATPYPWPGGPRADLAEARRLIEKHGYGRRLPELADAEAAAKLWPSPCSLPSVPTPSSLAPRESGPVSTPAFSHPAQVMIISEFDSLRLRHLEEQLREYYEQVHEYELEIARAAGGDQRIKLRRQLKTEITPKLRQLEQEYARLLAAGAQLESLPEEDARGLVAEVRAGVAKTDAAKAGDASGEMLRLLGELREQLDKPDKSAAAKLKVMLPIIPLLASYELEMDTEGVLTAVWRKAREFFKRFVPRHPR